MCLSYSTYNYGSQKTTVQLYNTKDHAIVIKKGTAVAQMVAANEVPETVVTDGTVGSLQTQRWAKEGCRTHHEGEKEGLIQEVRALRT